jgi:hypothetical protein
MDDLGLFPSLSIVTAHSCNWESAIGLLPCTRDYPCVRNSQHRQLRYNGQIKLPGKFRVTCLARYTL